MDKKTFTSWGVGFGSLALVAGMVSYLGITNKGTNNSMAATQYQGGNQSSIQQSPNSSFNVGSDQTAGNSQQAMNQSPGTGNSFFGQFGGFNTTTGGS
jgi:hypothetical protein